MSLVFKFNQSGYSYLPDMLFGHANRNPMHDRTMNIVCCRAKIILTKKY
jgi:hypothetical protein